MTSLNSPRTRNDDYCPVRDIVVRQACLYAPSFHALLATLCAWQAERPWSEDVGNLPRYRTLMYIHQAHCLQLVNKDIRGSVHRISQGTVQAIAFQVIHRVSDLTAAGDFTVLRPKQSLCGDYINCRVHLIGLHSVIQARGGMATLSLELQIFVVW
jgi:hypothetical protein